MTRTILTLLLLTSLRVAFGAEDSASIDLRVTPANLTADAPGVGPGVPVTVRQHHREDGEQVTTEAVTGEDGRAVLRLDAGHGTHLDIGLVYQGVMFDRHIVWDSEAPELEVQIDVYEPTTAAHGLRAIQHHVLLAPADGELRIREIVVISQTAKEVYVGREKADGTRQIALMSLPAGSRELHAHGASLDLGEDGRLTTSRPLMPGKNVFDLEYSVPLTQGRFAFSKQFVYPTDRYLVMMARGEYQLNSPDLKVGEEVMEDGATLQTVLCESLATGQSAEVVIEPGPGGATPPLHVRGAEVLGSSWLWTLLGGLLVAAVLILGLKRAPAPAAASTPPGDLAAFLRDQLAALEAAYGDNQVTRHYYCQARESLTGQLARLASPGGKQG